MNPATTPTRLKLKRDEKLEIDWQDGRRCVYTIGLLRSMCPCAGCKGTREGRDPHDIMSGPPRAADEPAAPVKKPKLSLTVLGGDQSGPLRAEKAEMVGNYAIRIDWSDRHNSGIYSFEYLRQICPG